MGVELRYRFCSDVFFGGLTTNLSFPCHRFEGDDHAIEVGSGGYYLCQKRRQLVGSPPKKVRIITDRFQQPICLGSELKSKRCRRNSSDKVIPFIQRSAPNNCTVGKTWRTSDLSWLSGREAGQFGTVPWPFGIVFFFQSREQDEKMNVPQKPSYQWGEMGPLKVGWNILRETNSFSAI